MAKFIPSRKHDPCEICFDTSGKCRTYIDGDFHLCMTYADSLLGEVVNGFKCVKENQGKNWASFVIDNTAEWTEDRKREWEDRKRERERKHEREQQERKAKALSPEKRDRLYRLILGNLDLHPDDRADLERRGFTEAEIELAGFKSVAKNQKLKSKVSSALPGVSWDGLYLLCDEGYLCPVRDINGLITACQIRLRSPKDGNRYRWLSNNNAILHLFPEGSKEGELPLTYLEPSCNPSQIWLCEGVGAKPHLLKERLGVIVIGAAGGQFASSPVLFKEYLEIASEQTGKKEITISPDAGDVLNPSVMNRWRAVYKLLTEWGYTVSFAWWNQFTKEDSDIDELDTFSLIDLISSDTFFHFAPQKVEEEKPEQKEVSTSDTPKSFEELRNEIRQAKLSYKPSLVLNQRYLKCEIPLAGMINIKSSKDTGKTTLLSTVSRENIRIGKKTLVITHRISLGQALVEKLGLNWIDESLSSDEKTALSRFLGLCIDSLHPYGKAKFNWEDWDGADVFIDEVEQFLKHLFTSTTINKKRSIILQTFTNLINHVLATGGRVICLDADLSNESIKYLKKITNGKYKPYIIRNEYQHKPFPVIAYNHSDPSWMMGDIKKFVGEGKRVLILADAQQESSSFGTYNLEKDILATRPCTKVIRVDSDTLGNPDHPAFGCIKDFDSTIKDYQVVFASPSINTGISIELFGHFDAVFLIGKGVLNAYDLHQFLWRLRDVEVPRYIWVKERGFVGQRGNIFAKSLLDKKIKITKKAIGKLVGLPSEHINIAEYLCNFHDRSWAEFLARDNASKLALREHLYEILENEGCKIELSEGDKIGQELGDVRGKKGEILEKIWKSQDEEEKQELKEELAKIEPLITKLDSEFRQLKNIAKKHKAEHQAIKEKSFSDWCEAVSQAINLDETTANQLDKSKVKTTAQSLALTKYKLAKKYGIDITSELVKTDKKRKYYNNLRTHYYLIHDREYLSARDLKHLNSRLNPVRGLNTSEEIEFPLTPQDIHLMSHKVELVDELGLLQFLDESKEFKPDSHEIEAIGELLLERAEEIRDVIGASITSEMKPMQRLQTTLLESVGLKLTRKSAKRKKGEKSQGKIYKFEMPEIDPRKAIFERWECEDKKRLQEMKPEDWQELSLCVSAFYEGGLNSSPVAVDSSVLTVENQGNELTATASEPTALDILTEQLIWVTNADQMWQAARKWQGDLESFEGAIYYLQDAQKYQLIKWFQAGLADFRSGVVVAPNAPEFIPMDNAVAITEEKPEPQFEVGQIVRVVSGYWEGAKGTIDKILSDGRVRMLVQSVSKMVHRAFSPDEVALAV